MDDEEHGVVADTGAEWIDDTPLDCSPDDISGSEFLLRKFHHPLPSFFLRQMKEIECGVPQRVRHELNTLTERRTALTTRRASLVLARKEGAPPEHTMTAGRTELAAVEIDIINCDTEIGYWCEQLTTTLQGGRYLLRDPENSEWTQFLYRESVCDLDFLFRSLDAWMSVVGLLTEIAVRRPKRWKAPPVEQRIPWRPLYNLFLLTHHAPHREREGGVHRAVQEKVHSVAQSLCKACPLHFDENAFEEMWEEFSPSFRPEGTSACHSLAYLVNFAPRFEMIRTDRQKKLTAYILNFLFVKTLTWHTQSANWLYFSWALLVKASPVLNWQSFMGHDEAHPMPIDYDSLAEPLFSSVLYSLRLPVGENDTRRSLKIGGVMDMFVQTGTSILQRVQSFIVELLPANTKSALWNQLRRLVRATELFLRPTAAVCQGSMQLATLYAGMMGSMLLRWDAQRHTPREKIPDIYYLPQESIDEFVGLLLSPLMSALFSKHKSMSAEALNGVQAACRMAPNVAMPEIFRYAAMGISASTEPHQNTIALEILGNAIPEFMHTLSTPPSTNQPPQLTPRSADHQTYDDPTLPASHRIMHFLHTVASKILPSIDSNDIVKTMLATRLVFQSAVYFQLRGVCLPPPPLPPQSSTDEVTHKGNPEDDKEVELHFMLQFLDKLESLSKHLDGLPKDTVGAYFRSLVAIFVTCRSSVVDKIAERICRKASELGTTSTLFSMTSLLTSICVARAEMCWKIMLPNIEKVLCDPMSSTSEIRWFSQMLAALMNCRSADIVFRYRQSIEHIVDTFLIRLTNKERVFYAGVLYENLVGALLRIHVKLPPNGYRDASLDQRLCSDGLVDLHGPTAEMFDWQVPSDEHVAYCVAMFNSALKRIFDDFDNLDTAVARLVESQGKYLGPLRKLMEQQQKQPDEDEAIDVNSVRRNLLRWMRKVTEINIVLMAARTAPLASLTEDALPSSAAAEHLLSCRYNRGVFTFLPRPAVELAFTADVMIEKILAIIPSVVGQGNYVAVKRPPSLTTISAAGGWHCEGSTLNPDVKAIRHILRILSGLCNTNCPTDSHHETSRMLFDNWRVQFQVASGVRRMPRFYWMLSSEVLVASRRNASADIAVSDSTMKAVRVTLLQLACHHRYAEVQQLAKTLLVKMLHVSPPEETIAFAEGAAEDLLAASSKASSLLSSGAIAASNTENEELPEDTESAPFSHEKREHDDQTESQANGSVATPKSPLRFDHELAGLLYFLVNVVSSSNEIVCCNELMEKLLFLSLEFPDILLPHEELLRRHLQKSLTNTRLRTRMPVDEFPAFTAFVVGKALKSATTAPSRSTKWLEFFAACFHFCFFQSAHPRKDCVRDEVQDAYRDLVGLSPAVTQQLFRLSVNDHPKLRNHAWHVIMYASGLLKRRVRKVRIPLDDPALVANADDDLFQRQAARSLPSDARQRIPWGMKTIGQFYLPRYLIADAVDGDTILSSSKHDEARELLKNFTGVSLIHSLAESDDIGKLKGTWIWQICKYYEEDGRSYRAFRVSWWKSLALLTQPDVAIPVYHRVFRHLVDDWRQQQQSLRTGNVSGLAPAALEKAKESHKGLFTSLSELTGAALRASKRFPKARLVAFDMLFSLVSLVSSPLASHDVLHSCLKAVMEVRDVVTVEEARQLFSQVFDLFALKCSPASGLHVGSIGSPNAGSQEGIRLLTLILQLLNTFSYDIIEPVVPDVIARIVELRDVFLMSPLSQLRHHSASVIRQLLQCSLYDSPLKPQSVLVSSLEAFSKSLLEFALPESRATFAAVTDETAAPFEIELPAGALYACKCNVVLWAYPAAPLMPLMFPSVLRFVARVLDVKLPEQDEVFSHISGTLITTAFARVEKAFAQQCVDFMCDVLLERFAFGRGRMSKMTFARALRIVLYINLHRIGKFSTMEKVTEAALCCMSHSDKRVRNEGKTLISIVVRIASAEQVAAIVRDLLQRLRSEEQQQSAQSKDAKSGIFSQPHTPVDEERAAPSTPLTPSSLIAPMMKITKRLAVTVALCGAVLADPDTVPPYVPRVMERLAPLARDRNPDTSSAVRQTFVEWWTSHRDRWSFAHKQCFTSQQLVVLMELFTTPSYYV